jgi:hypothetical protein
MYCCELLLLVCHKRIIAKVSFAGSNYMSTLLRDISIENIPASLGGEYCEQNKRFCFDVTENRPLWDSDVHGRITRRLHLPDPAPHTTLSVAFKEATTIETAVTKSSEHRGNNVAMTDIEDEFPLVAITEHDSSQFDSSFMHYTGNNPPLHGLSRRTNSIARSPRNNSAAAISALLCAVENTAVAAGEEGGIATTAAVEEDVHRNSNESGVLTRAGYLKSFTDCVVKIHTVILETGKHLWQNFRLFKLFLLLFMIWLFYESVIARVLVLSVVYSILHRQKWLLFAVLVASYFILKRQSYFY